MTSSSDEPASIGTTVTRRPSMWWPGLLGLVGAAFAQFKINQLREEGEEIRSKPYWVLGGSITAALVIIFSVVAITAVSATNKLQHDLQNQLAGGPFSSSQAYAGSQDGNAGAQTGSGSNTAANNQSAATSAGAGSTKYDSRGYPILSDGTIAQDFTNVDTGGTLAYLLVREVTSYQGFSCYNNGAMANVKAFYNGYITPFGSERSQPVTPMSTIVNSSGTATGQTLIVVILGQNLSGDMYPYKLELKAGADNYWQFDGCVPWS